MINVDVFLPTYLKCDLSLIYLGERAGVLAGEEQMGRKRERD